MRAVNRYENNLVMTTYFDILHVKKEKVAGVVKTEIVETGLKFAADFRTYAGSDVISNGVYVVEDTGKVKTWYNKNISSDVYIRHRMTKKIYEIIGEPENIMGLNKYMEFKVKAVSGGM